MYLKSDSLSSNNTMKVWTFFHTDDGVFHSLCCHQLLKGLLACAWWPWFNGRVSLRAVWGVTNWPVSPAGHTSLTCTAGYIISCCRRLMLHTAASYHCLSRCLIHCTIVKSWTHTVYVKCYKSNVLLSSIDLDKLWIFIIFYF